MDKLEFNKTAGKWIDKNHPTMPMNEVTAYKCPYCDKLFNTKSRHYPCTYDPAVLHCGDCVNGDYYRACYDDDGIGESAYWVCRKYGKGRSPRKLKCEFYEKREDKDITWRY